MRRVNINVAGGDGESCTNGTLNTERRLLRCRTLVTRLAGEQNRPGRQRTGVRNDEPDLLEHRRSNARILARWRRPAADDGVFRGVGGVEALEEQSLEDKR